jgi:hypothetical protein
VSNFVVWCMLHYQAQMLYSCNPKIISEQILSFQKKDAHLQMKPKTESRQNFITSIYCINCTAELWSCSSTLEIKMYHKFIKEFKSCNKQTTQSEAMWLKHNSMQCSLMFILPWWAFRLLVHALWNMYLFEQDKILN